MIRIASALYLWLMSAVYAFAQNAPDAPPTAYTEPASATAVVVFLLLFVGSIGLFGFWIWLKSRKHKTK